VVALADGYLRHETHPKDFIYAFVKKWSSGVSGGLSVTFTMIAIYATNPNSKMIVASLAIASMVFASYSLWSQEREKRLKTQEELDRQSAKSGRPEITLGLKSDEKGQFWACFMNYSDRAAVNVRIDEIPCGGQILGFINPMKQLTSGFSPNIEVYCKWEREESKRDIATVCILNLKKGTHAMEPLQLAVHYIDLNAEHDWVIFERCFYNFTTKAFDLEKQWVESSELKVKSVLTF
jgi:hypothetical protein